jgi:5-methylcytosine-specific restriction endonuclease McrA
MTGTTVPDDLDGEPFIRAVRQHFRVPEVVTLTHYDKLPVTHVAFSRRNLFKRDGYKCQYCGAHPRPDELTIDHIVPRSRGGESTWENCVLACIECNKRRPTTPRSTSASQQAGRPKWQPLATRHARWRAGRSLSAKRIERRARTVAASVECGVRNAGTMHLAFRLYAA